MQWVVAGGGTGGHVTPALALAECIRARGDEVFVLGGTIGLEATLVPAAGFELVALPARQIMGASLLARLRALPAMVSACLSARRILGQRGADFVVSVGGYASVPAVVGAVLRRIPVALVEPNAIPGRANRTAACFARRIFLGFEASLGRFGRLGRRAPERLRPVGIPLRRALLDTFGSPQARRRPEPPYRLLVFGGSQGARQINEAMMEAAPALASGAYRIFHQSGEADRERVEAAYREAGVAAEVVAFEADMPARYREADLAVCRSGALTVAELALTGLPALLVPYPFAADDHQLANARALADAGAARLLDSRPLSSQALVKAIQACLEDPDELLAMGERAAALARPDAAEVIVSECAALQGEKGGHV
jgi:UDP-N-acetylglucosamine--N-acetylmuramyl-(pentapeptide) pyrophosphoryl-undecaprenol N-acetylglucosamine transferase